MGSAIPGPLVLDLDATRPDLTAGPEAMWAVREPAGALAALVRLGAPVPAGFIVTPAACAQLSRPGGPNELWEEVHLAVKRLEARSGLAFGDPARPLLLTVRADTTSSVTSPAPATVVGIGMDDAVADGLSRHGAVAFARATYARLARTYGAVVPDRVPRGPGSARPSRAALPQDPMAQLHGVIDALARRDGPAARGLAVTRLVSGDRDSHSGSGVAYSRDPGTGAPGPVAEFFPGTTIDELGLVSRPGLDLAAMASPAPGVDAELARLCAELEQVLTDLSVIEFVVEAGRLWVLGAGVGRRSPAAAYRIAAALADEGAIDDDEALRRVDGTQLASLLRATVAPIGAHQSFIRGRPGGPGRGAGPLALDVPGARAALARGERPVVVLTAPVSNDVGEAVEWAGVITDLPCLSSPAVTQLRGLGVPCVAAMHGLVIDHATSSLVLPGGVRWAEGSPLVLDGVTGRVLQARHEVRPSEVAATLDGAPDRLGDGRGISAESPMEATARAVRRLLDHADRVRRVEVHANAETPEEARIARRRGAQGIGLLRTEHLLLGPRRELVERLVTGQDRDRALESLEAFTVTEFTAVLEAMDGLPVVVRLLDPPLQEFLPDVVDLSVRSAIAEERGHRDERLRRRLLAVRRWRETNPLLGLRGVRILTVLPQIVDVQVRALAEATIALRAKGRDPRPQVMIPLVAEVAEVTEARGRVDRIVDEVARDHGTDLDIPVGVMIELPRAALTAGAMARVADFFAFGTNDLSQTVWGISKDDAEATFLTAYRDSGILTSDPFVRLDEEGVGRLIQLAADEGRAARPDLRLGACGVQVDEPTSVGFLAGVGVDYLSCTTARLPVIRLQAGHDEVVGHLHPPSHRRHGKRVTSWAGAQQR